MASYRLFLDDLREISQAHPGDDAASWVMCRSTQDAIAVINARGWPMMISFDHDLGEDVPTGYDLARWLVEHDLDHGSMPDGFSFVVHSANPVGRANIEALLGRYIWFRNGGA